MGSYYTVMFNPGHLPFFKAVATLALRMNVLIVMSIPRISHAQERQVVHQYQQWTEYGAQWKLTDKYSVLFDAGSRLIDNYLKGTFYYTRVGLDRVMSKSVAVHAGFAHVGYFLRSPRLRQVEHRPYQEITVTHIRNKWQVQQRLRVEERVFTPVSAHAADYNWFNWRFRYMCMVELRAGRFFSFGGGEEIMFNAGRGIVHNHFDQSRLLMSTSLHTGKSTVLSVIWSNQYQATAVQDRFVHGQVVWVRVWQRLGRRGI